MKAVLELPDDAAVVAAAVEGLVCANAVIMRRATLPWLYKSGIRYRRDKREEWTNAATVLHRRWGDCEDLSAYRAAELRVRAGEPARCVVKRTGPRTLHVLVRRADGRIEDPSRKLGMGAAR